MIYYIYNIKNDVTVIIKLHRATCDVKIENVGSYIMCSTFISCNIIYRINSTAMRLLAASDTIGRSENKHMT